MHYRDHGILRLLLSCKRLFQTNVYAKGNYYLFSSRWRKCGDVKNLVKEKLKVCAKSQVNETKRRSPVINRPVNWTHISKLPATFYFNAECQLELTQWEWATNITRTALKRTAHDGEPKKTGHRSASRTRCSSHLRRCICLSTPSKFQLISYAAPGERLQMRE